MFKYVRPAASFLKCKPTINIERVAKYGTCDYAYFLVIAVL